MSENTNDKTEWGNTCIRRGKLTWVGVNCTFMLSDVSGFTLTGTWSLLGPENELVTDGKGFELFPAIGVCQLSLSSNYRIFHSLMSHSSHRHDYYYYYDYYDRHDYR